MQDFLNNELKDMTILNERLSLASAMKEEQEDDLTSLAEAIRDSLNEVS